MKARHLVVGTAVAGIATFAASGVDAHQPALELTCSHVRAEMFAYPTGSTYTLTVDGVPHSLNGAGYYDAALTSTLNHTTTFRIVSSDGQGNFDQTRTRDNCVPTTTTTAPTTTITQPGSTTSLPPQSSTTTPTSTVAPSTSTTDVPASTSTSSTSSTETSAPPPSEPSVPPSTPSLDPCLTSSTNSDGATSTGCSTSSPTTQTPTPQSLATTSTVGSALPSTGPSDVVPFAAAGLAALIGGSALVFVARRKSVKP